MRRNGRKGTHEDTFKASLTLLHLIEILAMAYGAPEAPVMFDFKIEEMKDIATQALEHFAQSRSPGTAVNTVVDEGDPGACIGELARNKGARDGPKLLGAMQ